VKSFPRAGIETTGPNIFQNLYISKTCFCVYKAPPLVPILLDRSQSSTAGPYPPPLVPIFHHWFPSSTTSHYASSLFRIPHYWSLFTTIGSYSPPLVPILQRWSLLPTTGPYPPPLIPILYHWSLFSITGPYYTPMVPTLHYFFDVHFKSGYHHGMRIYSIIFCLSSHHRSINVSLPEVWLKQFWGTWCWHHVYLWRIISAQIWRDLSLILL
jgi:hypothetical protein